MKKLPFTRWFAEGVWLLLLPVCLLIPGVQDFPFPPSPGAYSDIAISHYPNALYLLRSLQEWHSLPLWSPTILSGYPFAANPLSGLWYPFGWLALIFPLPMGFNLLSILHLLWGGYGMYRLLRLEGLGRQPALLGGLAFEAMPKLFAHFGAGHLTLVYAVCWSPWLFYCQKRASVSFFKAGGPRVLGAPEYWGARSGVVLGLTALADVRWAAMLGLFWLAVALWSHMRHFLISRNPGAVLAGLMAILFDIGLAGLLAAPQILPLLEYSLISTRNRLTESDFFALSLPPVRLLGLFFPVTHTPFEWMVYPGVCVMLLVSLGLVLPQVRRAAAGWLGMAAASVLFSIAPSLPGVGILAHLPVLSMMRVPSRAMFLFGMALAALAAHTLANFTAFTQAQHRRRGRLTLLALAGFGWVLTGGILAVTGSVVPSLVWGTAMLSAAGVWLAVGMQNRRSHSAWVWAVIILSMLELAIFDARVFTHRSSVDVLSENRSVAVRLQALPGLFRVYSPSYSLPQHTAAAAGLELADGIDPLQLQAYVDFMQRASGVPWAGYSVTLPPFAGADPANANRNYLPDPALLGLLNVKYIASSFEISQVDFRWIERVGQTNLYENQRARPRAWVQPGLEFAGLAPLPVSGLEWRPNQIVVRASGPGVLVLSEIAYPGWGVLVDGEPAEMLRVAGILRAVRLPAGEHLVRFEFRPLSVFAGLGLGLMGWLICLWMGYASLRRPV